MANRKKWNDRKRARFLELLEGNGLVREACAGVDMSVSRMYEIREADKEFKAEWDAAVERSIHALEEAATKRALGWTELQVTKDGREFEVQRHSDVLLMFLMKRRDPSYRDSTKMEVTGKDGGPISHRDDTPMTPEERQARLQTLLVAAAGRKDKEDGGDEPSGDS